MSAPLPPHDLDAESSLLGALMLDRDAVAHVAPILMPGDFYTQKHGLIFRAITDLFTRREPADMTTVTAELAKLGTLDQVGGRAAIAELLLATPHSVHAPHYGEIVRRHAAQRRLIDAGTRIVRMGYDADADLTASLSDARTLLNGVDRSTGRERGRILADALVDFATDMEAGWNGEYVPDVIPTKFYDIDRALSGGGFGRGQLIFIAARPSMGKTAFALALARAAAEWSLITKIEPEWTLIFSAEMTLKSLLWRVVAEVTGIASEVLKHGHGLSYDQKAAIMDQIAEMMKLPIWIDESSSPTTDYMRQRIERFQQDRPVNLVIFDYMEQAGESKRSASEEQRISKVAADLKSIAKDTGVAVVALSQLNREVEKRPGKIPMLADLRWSGRIEQEADIVMFLYRQDYYETKGMFTEKEMQDIKPEKRGTCDVIIAKQRDGATPTIPLRFIPELTAFRNLDRGAA